MNNEEQEERILKEAQEIIEDEDDLNDFEDDLDTCEQCGENAWDGYICHNCGLKKI